MRRTTMSFTAGAIALAGLLLSGLAASAAPALTQISSDPFTNRTSQHQTEVEPDMASNGATLVGVFQVGRVASGGGADIGWATSTDSGAHWTHGFMPGITVNQGGGKAAAVSDPAVSYDAKHGRWLVVSLPISGAGNGVDVSSSTDGLTWANPVVVTPPAFLDKTWIGCDSTAASPFYGNCYTEWDNPGNGDQVLMSVSKDGGATWSTPSHPAGADGLGGQPLVQPNGTVVVPFLALGGNIASFRSTDGGATWSAVVAVASAQSHNDPGGFRAGPLPSANLDSAGKVYVTWEGCLLETGCSTNDALLSTSADGLVWSTVKRIPTNATGTTIDVTIPGIGVDHATQGAGAHLGVVYYFFPNVGCSVTTCQLDVGFISSADGGATWSAAQQLAGPMSLSWIAKSQNGRMVGDYFATAFSGGKAFPIFAVGKKPAAGHKFDEAMYTVNGGVTVH
jgi:hypothetical protein